MSSTLAPREPSDAARARSSGSCTRRFVPGVRLARVAATLLALLTLGAGTARAQFVTGGALVPGPSAANFPLWGTIASPISGVMKVDDGFDFASGGNSGANFARIWIGIGTQLGGSTPVSPSDTVQYVYIRIDHKGVPEEGSNFNMQLNLGGAPAGRVDHLLSLRPVFSGPNVPYSGRVRIALKQYATDAGGNYPLLGAFTTSSFVGAATIDNAGTPAEGTAIGWEAVATDGKNGFELRIPAGWFHGDATRLVQVDGSGASSVVAALFSSGGSFGAVATVLDKFADASGNNVLINVNTTTGAHSTVVGTQLAYGTQPAAANTYTTLGAFTVKQQNADGTTVTGGTASISLAIASGPVGGTITGTTTRSASSGVATFNDISFSVPGTYTLKATSTGLLAATSSSFIISATAAPAPTITSITAGNAQLSVNFTAPANDGGSAITTYQYSTNNGTNWTTRATGTTASPLLITGLTNGTTYPVRIRAVNGIGNGTQSNAVNGTPSAPAPAVNTVVPAITGTTTVGQTLTTSTGTWTGSPTPTYTYQWQRCDALGANCANIGGATASTYLLVSADAGSTMRSVVTGTNVSGSATGTSVQTAVVAEAPVNTVLPSISGTTVSGQLLTAANGTWTGTPTPTYGYQWQRCDTSGANCTNIVGATSGTYTLVSGDVGSTVRIAVTGTNTAGFATATAVQTATITAAPALPANTVAPAITGVTTVGQTLTATTGSWSGFPAPTYGYQWRRCDLAGNNCADLVGETASTYALVTADAGTTMRVVVTGTNASGSATGTSDQTAAIALAPANTVPPTIGGTTTVGQTLTAGAGTWTGYPAPALTYQWKRCDASGNNCADIVAATASTYALIAADVGATIRVVETGTNSAGNASATSTQSASIAAAPVAPGNTVAPAISGTTTVGQLLTATTGTWNGYPAPTYTYQWRRCDASGNACADISGETASTYTLTTADAGNTIRVVVTGTNVSGSATGTSAQAGPIAEAPVNTVAPSITGTSTEGQLLTAAPGTWTGYPTPVLTYQWLRCDTSGTNCANIVSATSSTYTLAGADVGSTVRVAVTGTNVAGNATGTATKTATIAAAPAAPSNTGVPTISGTTTVGQLLTATAGSWTGNPAPTLGYQWQRCDLTGANCSNLAGETAMTYTLVTADAGSTMRVVETGTNGSGSASASSAQTAAVNVGPANTALPTISGTTTEGQTLGVTDGSWTGYPAPTHGYQWRRCDSAGNNCADIASATSSSYLLVSGDVGATIRAVVTGTNVVGSAPATTLQTAAIAVAPALPANSALPTVSGTTTVGQLLTATGGTWTGTPAPTLGYQWERCDAAGANCANVGGATASTYTLVVADTGSTMRVAVTGTNASGSTTASSAQTSVVNMPPANSVAPTIGGSAIEGQLLTAAPGSWTGSPSPTYGYQWRRCDAAGSNCANIGGATSSTYTLGSGDVGSTVRVEVTGTNVAGNATATSVQTATVAVAPATPANTAPPTITGTTTVGQILTVAPGTWTGTPAPTVGEQWQRCDAAGNNCVNIPGETGNTYTLTTGDAGSTFRVVETGTNGSGSSTATSVQTAPVTSPPVNTVPPSITGTPTAGQILSGSPGTWTGYPAPTLGWQWQRCDAAGANCVDIPGATTGTYTLGAGDVGSTIREKVTGTNTAGTSSATSGQTSVVAAAATPPTPTPPAAVTPPTIGGTPQVGTPLTADPGNWADPSPVGYQWQRCDASGTNCTDVPGATGQTYTPVPGDQGGTIQVVVTNTATGAKKTARTGPVVGTTPTAGGSKVYTPPVSNGTNGAQAGSAPADSVPADGTRYAVVRVELFDAAGNPVTGRASDDFVVTIDGVAVTTAVRETATPGVYELEVRSSTVNQVTLGVSVNGVALKQQAVVRFVQATANIDIQLTASSETPEVGQQVVFTVVVKNPGPNAATGVEVEQKLSDRVRYVSSDATRGQYDAARGIWSIGGIALNESVSLKITVTVIK